MSVSVCPVAPVTTCELSETDPGYAATAVAPVAATPVVVAVAAFGAGAAFGVAVTAAIGETQPVLE
ncbi:hypothetical protein [Streptomyces jumonjinensis]|uniref:Uncharacterized protein n=1 Tax=Streptomyces jumonjinensis TaxID=1945 RepID=A0A646KLB8_STRJU|nr:hypothetical protein [Streptomyces jumonjinensis]MQT03109.1 hypothetical protein [Streptomyces jumonjinensis]